MSTSYLVTEYEPGRVVSQRKFATEAEAIEAATFSSCDASIPEYHDGVLLTYHPVTVTQIAGKLDA